LPPSPTSIDQFFEEHFPIIRAKCARMLGDGEEAADIAQETFLRLCASPVAHEPPAARARWIYQTSTRMAIDRLRHVQRGVEVKVEADAPGQMPAADAVLEARQVLAALARRLSPEELEVAILSRCDDLSHDEVAAVVGRSARTVRRLLDAALGRAERLKRSLP
jgi:RNA polymerase sigma-70 factor (ECF subfamily)